MTEASKGSFLSRTTTENLLGGERLSLLNADHRLDSKDNELLSAIGDAVLTIGLGGFMHGFESGQLLHFEKHLPSRCKVFHYELNPPDSKSDAEGKPTKELTINSAEDVKYLVDYVKSDNNRHITWVDVQGLGSESLMRNLASVFGIHEMALDVIVNTPQRVKTHPYDNHVLYVTRMLGPPESHHDEPHARHVAYEHEQLSVILGRNYVITFQERYGEALNPVRTRAKKTSGPCRQMGADYLAYTIVDTVIDGYYPVLETLGDELNLLEFGVISNPTSSILSRINATKRELMFIRRAVWPQRDALNLLTRGEIKVVSERVRTYLRDCYDHTIQLADIVESYRELSNNLLNTYLSALGQKTNEIMKFLTIVGAIFIPLTFLAGLYGMNFHNMPELDIPWAYPTVLIIMVIIAMSMLVYFKSQGWICVPDSSEEDADAHGDGPASDLPLTPAQHEARRLSRQGSRQPSRPGSARPSPGIGSPRLGGSGGGGGLLSSHGHSHGCGSSHGHASYGSLGSSRSVQ